MEVKIDQVHKRLDHIEYVVGLETPMPLSKHHEPCEGEEWFLSTFISPYLMFIVVVYVSNFKY